MPIEVYLAETLLEVFEELGQLLPVADQGGDHVHQELVHLVCGLETYGRVVSEGGVVVVIVGVALVLAGVLVVVGGVGGLRGLVWVGVDAVCAC